MKSSRKALVIAAVIALSAPGVAAALPAAPSAIPAATQQVVAAPTLLERLIQRIKLLVDPAPPPPEDPTIRGTGPIG